MMPRPCISENLQRRQYHHPDHRFFNGLAMDGLVNSPFVFIFNSTLPDREGPHVLNDLSTQHFYGKV